ncbi:MAG: MFS transporter [Pirellulales bacterium]|nr:MFS transporter [Pirellulales bacterium]
MHNPPTTNPAGFSRSAEVFAWAMYDWANSAYSTLSITILVNYIQRIVFPENLYGDTGAVVWAWGIAGSMLLAAILSPVVGAMADANSNKRTWLAATGLGGAAAGVALGLVPPNWPWAVVAFFFVTSLLFELSLGFYNGFLPEIADEETMNRVSARGYALGYIGGAMALILAILFLKFGARIGIADPGTQLRIGLVVMGIWWGLFTVPTVWILRDRRPAPEHRKPLATAGRQALREVAATLRNVRQYQMLAIFLLGFLFYNDGIQTVISQASTFAIQDLKFTTDELIGLILMIQFLAMPGALLVGWLGDRIGQKPTLMGSLAIWVGLVVTAYFIQSKAWFWALGVVLAVVMGGTQSVSRAIMGMMTPESRTAEFFGFFNLTGKATSFMGTFLFGLVILLTGSARQAIVSLVILFLLGWALADRVNVAEGRRQALETVSQG